MTAIENFVQLCLTQKGYPYKWGGKASPTNSDPKGNLDCSGLVEWAAGRAGQPLTGGSWQQLETCQKAGLQISVAQAIVTRGALLFIPANGADHVAVSLGDGMTIEARGAAWGIGSWPAAGRFQSAALVPGFNYPKGNAVTTAPARLVRDPSTQRVYLQTLGNGHLWWIPDTTPDLAQEETAFGQPENYSPAYLKTFPGYLP